MRKGDKFRIVTYNVHKCVGVDRRLNPARIVSVLKEINADIIALQEVHCVQGRGSQSDQAHFIAHELGFNYCMGHNRKLKEGIYGNLVLSRFPLLESENHDISVTGAKSGAVCASTSAWEKRTGFIFITYTSERPSSNGAIRLVN